MVNGNAGTGAYCMHTMKAKHLLMPLRPQQACRQILCLPIIRKFQNNIFAFAPFCNAPWPCKPVQAVWVWGRSRGKQRVCVQDKSSPGEKMGSRFLLKKKKVPLPHKECIKGKKVNLLEG